MQKTKHKHSVGRQEVFALQSRGWSVDIVNLRSISSFVVVRVLRHLSVLFKTSLVVMIAVVFVLEYIIHFLINKQTPIMVQVKVTVRLIRTRLPNRFMNTKTKQPYHY